MAKRDAGDLSAVEFAVRQSRARALLCLRGMGAFVVSVRDEAKPCWGWIHVVSIFVAVALHGLALYAVASLLNKPIPPQQPLTVVVSMENPTPAVDAVTPSTGAPQAAPRPSRKAKSPHEASLAPSRQPMLSSDIPVPPVSSMASAPVSTESTAPESQASEGPPSSSDMAAGVTVGADLAFFCPARPAPVYPQISRKMGEEGTVLLRVEWDRGGKMTSSRVLKSSGFRRLDEAALAAMSRWRCNPAIQDGLPVRAVTVQPFSFGLEEE